MLSRLHYHDNEATRLNATLLAEKGQTKTFFKVIQSGQGSERVKLKSEFSSFLIRNYGYMEIMLKLSIFFHFSNSIKHLKKKHFMKDYLHC